MKPHITDVRIKVNKDFSTEQFQTGFWQKSGYFFNIQSSEARGFT
jgi:hypothetical protein